jgi:predicted esterase
MRTAALLLAASLLLPAAAPAAEEPPFPEGTSSHRLEELTCSVVMPSAEVAAKQGRSLLVILHGNGGSETGMAGSLAHLAADGFTILAPKSRGVGWVKKDVEDVIRIARDVKKRLAIPEGRVHAAGFSNGGWNLAPLAFDDGLLCASACWIAAGYDGGSVPKWARKSLGVLALAGAGDGNAPHALKTPELLEGKVRCGEALLQPGLGHAWPEKLMGYYRSWLLAMEGRWTPGDCGWYDWVEEVPAGDRKAGSFLYLFDPARGADAAARVLQVETLRDPLVRRYGVQLAAVKRDGAAAPDLPAAHGVKELPAVVVLDPAAKAVKVLSGPKITAAALAAAFRSVAPDKSPPKK